MSQLTTYRAKGKTLGLVFLFKYHLNGDFKLFELVEGTMNDDQINWLFSGKFPSREEMITKQWMKLEKFRKVFVIEKSAADLSFNALWELYDHKVKKVESEKVFNKLNEADIIKLFISIPGYMIYLNRKRTAKMMLATFINQRCFEDEWQKA